MLAKAKEWLLARDRNPKPVNVDRSFPFPVAYVFQIKRLSLPDVFFVMELDSKLQVKSIRRFCTY